MSITLQVKKVRQRPSISWYVYPDSHKELTLKKYATLSSDMPDLLTLIATLTFPDQETHDAWAQDPDIKRERDLAAAYDISVGISTENKYL